MPAAFLIPAIIGAGASVGSAYIAARGAKSAAQTQADAAREAASTYDPYRQVGGQAVNRLNELMGPGGQLSQTFDQTFHAPGTLPVNPMNPGGAKQDWTTADPGYAFRLAEGQKALERSASSRGTLLTGGTAKALTRYGQDYASNEYQNVYNRAQGEFQQSYNIFRQNQNDLYNRNVGLANLGYGATGQAADLTTSGAAAQAAGTVGASNAWAGGLNNVAGQAMDYAWLSRLFPSSTAAKTQTGSSYGGGYGAGSYQPRQLVPQMN